MHLLSLCAFILAAATVVGWLAKTSKPKSNSGAHHTVKSSLRFSRRSIKTGLIIVMVLSSCFLVGSHLTLLRDRENSISEANGMNVGMGPPMPQSQNTDDNGLLYEKRPPGKFPARKKHIIAHGIPRTASTLLFNMVGVSNFLHLKRYEPQLVPYIETKYVKDEQDFHTGPAHTTKIFKTHIDLNKFLRYDAVIFTTATTSKEAAAIKLRLEEEGHDVAYVQDMETLKNGGIKRIAADFAYGYNLPDEDEEMLVEYMSKWEVLRQCCGQQMSKYWRNDLTPEAYNKQEMKHHPFCSDYDIDEIENAFMKTKLYSWLDAYPNMRLFNKPSLRDGELNGTYCSSYNERIKTEALNFYGQPRPMKNIRTGNWTEEEHSIFLEGLNIHGSEPKYDDNHVKVSKPIHAIAKMIGTRTEIQVLKHMQDYMQEEMRNVIHTGDNDERIKESSQRKGNAIPGQLALAYDETGKLILVDKTSMSKVQGTEVRLGQSGT